MRRPLLDVPLTDLHHARFLGSQVARFPEGQNAEMGEQRRAEHRDAGRAGETARELLAELCKRAVLRPGRGLSYLVEDEKRGHVVSLLVSHQVQAQRQIAREAECY